MSFFVPFLFFSLRHHLCPPLSAFLFFFFSSLFFFFLKGGASKKVEETRWGWAVIGGVSGNEELEGHAAEWQCRGSGLTNQGQESVQWDAIVDCPRG